MTSSQPDPDQDQAQAQAHSHRVLQDYNRFLHASTLTACVLAPVLIALPPRKIDLYTFFLSGAFIASVDYQIKERTSLGIMGHASRRFILRDPPRRQGHDDGVSPQWEASRILLEEPSPRVMQSSMLQQRVQEDWKQQRLKEEQEKLDQGEGYWDMIKDQVWQVWNQEERKVEELKEKDEVVVRAREEKG